MLWRRLAGILYIRAPWSARRGASNCNSRSLDTKSMLYACYSNTLHFQIYKALYCTLQDGLSELHYDVVQCCVRPLTCHAILNNSFTMLCQSALYCVNDILLYSSILHSCMLYLSIPRSMVAPYVLFHRVPSTPCHSRVILGCPNWILALRLCRSNAKLCKAFGLI